MKKKFNKVKKIAAYSLVGGLGLVLAGGLAGCDNGTVKEQQSQQGAFVVIEETAPGKYKILNSKTHLLPRESGDLVPGFCILPGAVSYVHSLLPVRLFW